MYLATIFVVFGIKKSYGGMRNTMFNLGPLDKHLNCIEFIANYGIRSAVECGLRASGMDYYENSFVYRNGECYVCRANNMNCAAQQTEIQLVGPHYVKGRFLNQTVCVWYD